MLYNLVASLFWLALQCVTPFNKKIKLFVKGRKQELEPVTQNAIWFHCASVGEFEQARPLIELIKKEKPEENILVTFFSPSGFEHFKDYKLAEQVLYSPFDTKSQVTKFLELHQPKTLILIKYEFWRNLIGCSASQDIPVYSVASIFRPEQRFFGALQRYFSQSLKHINYFFLQNEESQFLLRKIGIENSTVIGDTRFDRVIKIAEHSQDIESIKKFCGTSKVLVAGSTWLVDEKMLAECKRELPDWKFIIAPHEVKSSRIEQVKTEFKSEKTLVYSGAKSEELTDANVVIIDSIGMLNRLYSYADLCYVGGAFGAGLHNILEAAVYGKAIFHGPKIQKFQEATELLTKGATLKVEDFKRDKSEVLDVFTDDERRLRMGEISKEFVYENLGASLKVISHLKRDGIL